MDIPHKTALLILMTILLVLGSHERVAAQTGRAGIKGGVNRSNLYLSNVKDELARIGFHVGVYGQFLSSEKFALQPELLFSTKGSKARYGGTINQQVTYHLNYLDVPVLAVFKLGKVGEIQVGGYACYLLSANISYQGDFTKGFDPIDKHNLKSFDYGFSGGMGANFYDFQFGARYNFGFVAIADSSSARSLLGNSKNSCTQVYVSFNFGD